MDVLSIVTVVLLLVAAIVLHEVFHVWVAKCLGIRFKAIFIGLPLAPTRTLFVANIPVHLSPWLLGGGVVFEDRDFWYAPFWKKAFVVAYGPISNLIAAMMVAFAVFGPTKGLAISQQVFGVVVQTVGLLLSGNLTLDDLSSPVEVINVSSQIIQIDFGIGVAFVWLILNFAIGATNLLPLPALDGGHIVMGALCSLAGNSPKSLAIAKATNAVFIVVLMGVVILLTVRDVLRMIF